MCSLYICMSVIFLKIMLDRHLGHVYTLGVYYAYNVYTTHKYIRMCIFHRMARQILYSAPSSFHLIFVHALTLHSCLFVFMHFTLHFTHGSVINGQTPPASARISSSDAPAKGSRRPAWGSGHPVGNTTQRPRDTCPRYTPSVRCQHGH